MKLQQLRYLREIVRRGLNLSEAAARLHTSQPGVSKQIQQLEDELGVELFVRQGKRFTALTEPAQAVLVLAERILLDTDNIRKVGQEFRQEARGLLSIAATHTQARYALPRTVKAFTEQFPEVALQIHQGNPTQVADMVKSGEADIGVATEAITQFPDLVTLPCYQWNRCVIAPAGHPLLQQQPLSLIALAEYPIITYDTAFAGRPLIDQAFEAQGLSPNIVLTAIDSDIIKTYVGLGLGIGILAQMAYDAERDQPLQALDASHLFAPSTTHIAVRRGSFLRSYVYAFIALFAPQLQRPTVEAVLQ